MLIKSLVKVFDVLLGKVTGEYLRPSGINAVFKLEQFQSVSFTI